MGCPLESHSPGIQGECGQEKRVEGKGRGGSGHRMD